MDLLNCHLRQYGQYAVAGTNLHTTAGVGVPIQTYVHDAGEVYTVARNPWRKQMKYLKTVSYQHPGCPFDIDSFNLPQLA
jgi:hypothetical protein